MYSTLCSWENLWTAYRLAAKGKRGSPAVAQFERRREENLLALQEDLISGNYRPGAYRHFFIHEPKRRLISAAPFRDRVVHHALCQLIEPSFERSFITDSYANRVGKGTHRALDRAQYFARRFPYVLHLDVRQFFPNVDHAFLFEQLSRKVEDGKMRWLIRLILSSGLTVPSLSGPRSYFPGDDLFAIQRPRGLPIGNLTSQFWANVYMNSLDHYIKRTLQCRGYLRYVDDLLLFADSKNTLWAWKREIQQRLVGLRLEIHTTAQPRPVTEGFAYLGFVLYPDRRLLLRRKAVHFRQRLKNLLRTHAEGEADLKEVQASVGGWINHVRYGNTVGLQKAVLTQLPVFPTTIPDSDP